MSAAPVLASLLREAGSRVLRMPQIYAVLAALLVRASGFDPASAQGAGSGLFKGLTLIGEAGVGKTTLVRELWSWLAAQMPQPLQRTGRCLPYGQVAYWALGEILKEQLGILERCLGEDPLMLPACHAVAQPAAASESA